MRAPGDILLVGCYELGHPPLSLAMPAAFLERAGFRPALVDLAVEQLADAALAQAKVVVVSVPMHTALRVGVRASRRIRAANPSAHLVFAGLYAQLNAAHLLAHHCDAVLAGEWEAALVAQVERLERGEAVERQPPAVKDRLDFPLPARRSLPTLDRYAQLAVGAERHLAGSVEASRGCKHTCRHCPITPVYGGRFFVVPQEVVLADVAQQVEQGARHITFADPDFLNGPRHALAIARALHARWPHLTFDATVKVEHLLKHQDVLPELAQLGCLFLVSAFESLHPKVLEELDKGHTAEDLATATRLVHAAGMALRPTFVAFTPWESMESRLALFEFVAAEGLVDSVDPIQYTLRLLVPPGSALLERPAMQAHLGTLDAEAFGWRWTHPDPRMDRLAEQSGRLVQESVRAERSARETFELLWEQTLQAAGAPVRVLPRRDARGPERVPHLTEAWFC